ncbi:helix-turn-helix transcriptional regulator [Microbacterium sp. NPDC055910]|uniref:helix-turn-helix transcriptional regulator n=1 Tax=Microbacterium sp. NPDC055910 TaxID=3345659 RepID=UPI0035D75DA6
MSTGSSVEFVADLDSKWLTADELAAALPGITLGRLSQWRKDGRGPNFHKFGRTVLYCREEVDEWIAATVRHSTSDRGRRRP